MFKKILISIIILYFLVLLQASFFVHFAIGGIFPNLILILIIIWNVFEKPRNELGLYMALSGGFFLDIFSSFFIGYNILISMVLVILIKLIFRRYVRVPFFEKI